VPGCFMVDSVNQCNSMEKSEIWPPLSPKPPNRWSPHLSWVMRSGTLPPCKILSQSGFCFLPLPLRRAGTHVQSDSTSLFYLGSYSFLEPSRLHRFLPRCMQCRRGLAMRILSVCLSVTRVHCDKMVERSVQIYMPYER